MKNRTKKFAVIAAIMAGGLMAVQAAEQAPSNQGERVSSHETHHCDHWYRNISPGHKNRCSWDNTRCGWDGASHGDECGNTCR